MLVDVHLGVVMVNDSDPDKAFGIEVIIDSILPDNVWPELCKPIFPPNSAKAPDVGQIVECLVIADEHDESGWSDLGVENEPDFCFYTGRIFDLTDEGKIPDDLKVNYPKRAGLFWDADGTIVYYDATKNAKEFMIALTDKKVFFRLREDEIFMQQDTVSWQMKNKKIVTTVDVTEMGAAGANHPITKGDILKTFLEAVQSGFGKTHTHTYVSPLHAGPTIATGPPSPEMPDVPSNLNSTKHKVDE